MHAVKQFLERRLGLPAAGPGQGTDWRIDARGLGPDGVPTWVVALVGAALVGGLAVLYFREARRLGVAKRLTLLILRLLSIAAVAAMVTQATLAIDRTGLPVVAVLLDTSASMSLPNGTPAAAGSETAPTRFDAARGVLTERDAAFLTALARRFRIRLYRFDAEAAPIVPQDGGDATPAALAARLNDLQPDGRQTQPAAAVRRVLDDLRGSRPAGVIVLTDGVSTTGAADALSSAAATAARRRTPLFPVGVGRDGPGLDLELIDMTADEIAFLGDPVRVEAGFRAYGLAGRTVRLTLTDLRTGKRLARMTAEAAADGVPVRAELAFVPETEGELEVSLTLRLTAGGPTAVETNLDNNTAMRHVSVRRQQVRVLLADRTPRYEFRFLKSLLSREPTVELRTVLQEADLAYAAEDPGMLPRFPLRRDELFAYDVVILGDLDSTMLGDETLASLAEFVKTRGGGLIGVAGPGFLPAGYGNTPLAEALPVVPESVTVPPAGSPIRTGAVVRPTLQGRQAGAAFRLAPTEAESDAVWRTLPPLYWRAEVAALRPGAVPLLEAAIDGEETPLMVMQRYGAGKVLLNLTDETWRWRFREGDERFGRFWIQTIRFLSRSALLGRDRAADLTTDRRSYQQGDPVVVRARLIDPKLSSPDGTLTATIEEAGGGRRTLRLIREGELSDLFTGRLDRLPEGNYRAVLGGLPTAKSPPDADFRIEPPNRELSRRGADLDDLRRAATLSGGRYFDVAQASRLPAAVPAAGPVSVEAGTPLPLWNRPELLLALAMLLTAEWLLRKRSRLA